MIVVLLLAIFALIGLCFAGLAYSASKRRRAGQRGVNPADVAAGRSTK
jgi:hypothetical protein